MASSNPRSNVWNRNLEDVSSTGSSASKTSTKSSSISKASNENSSAWTPSTWNVTNTTSVMSLKDVMSEQLSESSRNDKTWEERTRQRFVSSEPWYPGKVGRRNRNVGNTSVSKSNSSRQTSGKPPLLSSSASSSSSSSKDIYLEYDTLSKQTGIQVVNVHKQDLMKIGFNSLADWVKVPGHVYVGRDMTRFVPGAVGSKWHNPFKSRNCSREQICRQFKEYIRSNKTITDNGKTLYQSLDELKGKTLGCWCHPERCHGHMLMELVSEVCGD